MQEGKKVPFSDVAISQTQSPLAKLQYAKVKIVFYNPDKSTRAIIFKYSARGNLVPLVAALRAKCKLRQHDSLFLYLNKRIVDQKKTLSQLCPAYDQQMLVLEAATADIF